MIFHLPKDNLEFQEYANKLKEKDCTVELKKKQPKRTNKQNRYLHLILSYFALETGYSLEYVKQHFFKYVANYRTFVKIVDGKLGEVQELRSTKNIDSKEMTLSIDRFKDFSVREAGILLPDAEDEEFLKEIEKEITKHQNNLYL